MARKKKGQRSDGLIEIKRKMADGRYKHFYGANKAECEAKYREALIVAAQAAEEQAVGPMFSTLAEEWWGKRCTSLSPNTLRVYRPMVKQVIQDFGQMRAASITPNTVILWLEKFADDGKAKKTAANYKIILSDILQYGHEKYNLPRNPARSITLPAGMKSSKRKMPDERQLAIIMNGYHTDWVCQIYYIFAFTGLRLGELLALQWQDINADTQTIAVTKAVYWDGTRAQLKPPKTEAGVRVVPYLPQIQAVLEPQRCRGNLYVIHGPRSSGELPMSRTSYYKMREHAKKLGLTSTPHALRHAFATLCCEYGVDARTAGAIFGWENPSRMEDIYAEIRKKKVQHAGALLSEAVY